jgi:2-C-methyl-D-erythritol 2,4-cyclodiphosphate synthase
MVRVLAAARQGGGVVPVLPVPDSLKTIDASYAVTGAVDRDAVVAAQTPQAASLVNMRAAMEETHAWGRGATDEAAALAAGGIPVQAVPGELINRKLTESGDQAMLRGALAAWTVPLGAPPVDGARRAGIGFDAHRLGAERELRLAGLVFPGEPGLAGHSDGDVALHATIDALLGAAGAGDIGTLFPSDDPQWAGADSGDMTGRAIEFMAHIGWRPVSLDLTIVARRPPVAPRRDELVKRLAQITGLEPSALSVKGTTSDGLGFAGAEGIATFAVAVVEPIG